MQSIGYKVVYDPTFEITQTEFNQNVIAMKNAGVKILFLEQMPQNYAAAVVQALNQQDFHPVLVLGGSTYSEQLMPSAGGPSAINGSYMEQNTALYLGEDAAAIPAIAAFQTWVQKASPGFKADLYTLFGWLSAELFTQALKAAGPHPSRGSILQQLRKITSFSAATWWARPIRRPRSPPTATSSPRSPTGSSNGWTTRRPTAPTTATGATSRTTTPSRSYRAGPRPPLGAERTVRTRDP